MTSQAKISSGKLLFTSRSLQFPIFEDFWEETGHDSDDCDFLILYNTGCQHLGDLNIVIQNDECMILLVKGSNIIEY